MRLPLLLLLIPLLATAAPGDECFRLYYALEKNLARLYLGAMYMQGHGGPVDFVKARSLFTGCVRELGLEYLLKKMDALESGKTRPTGISTFAGTLAAAP